MGVPSLIAFSTNNFSPQILACVLVAVVLPYYGLLASGLLLLLEAILHYHDRWLRLGEHRY